MSSESATQHRAEASRSIRCAVVTVSDTRTLETDTGGQTIVDLLEAAEHQVTSRVIVRDEPDQMRAAIVQACDQAQAILITGGTGISARDQTFETISGLLDKTLPGYGELFRMLSYQEIGAAAMLSRTVGGIMGQTVVLTMPGSRAAVRLAMEGLILPEIAHLVHEATK